jgi:hypothetical protein
VDPWRQQLSVFTDAGLADVDAFRLPEQDVEIRVPQLLEGIAPRRWNLPEEFRVASAKG